MSKSVEHMGKLVRVYKWAKKPETGISPHLWHSEKVADFHGKFLGWGIDSEEFQHGAASHTVAIVEKDDGHVELVYAGLIQFLQQ